MDELLETPEGADLHDILRIKEYNMKVITRQETRFKDYYQRVNFHERDIQRSTMPRMMKADRARYKVRFCARGDVF